MAKELNALIEKMNERFEKIERRLTQIEHIIKPKKVEQDIELDQLVALLKRNVLEKIHATWDAGKDPTEARILSQSFSRRSHPIGGLGTVFRVLLDEGKITELKKLTGARMFVPAEAIASLTAEQVELLREHGMGARDIRRFREREHDAFAKRVGAELTPDEEADIERQNAEFIAQIEKQKGLV